MVCEWHLGGTHCFSELVELATYLLVKIAFRPQSGARKQEEIFLKAHIKLCYSLFSIRCKHWGFPYAIRHCSRKRLFSVSERNHH